jgi:Protein kinase domain
MLTCWQARLVHRSLCWRALQRSFETQAHWSVTAADVDAKDAPRLLLDVRLNPLAQAKTLMFQLFDAIEYLHDNWVLHRDLKTSNILYNNRGELKVCPLC